MRADRPTVHIDGLLCAFLAFAWWGMVPPLFFNELRAVGVFETLAHRIVWSVPLLGGVIVATGRLRQFRDCFRDEVTFRRLLLTTVLIGANWVTYVYGVVTQQVVQTSLGYFMNPLLNVVLGMVFFHERLRRLQWLAVLLASAGVLVLTFAGGQFPWIALTLAFSFGIYGSIRKTVAADGIVCLMVEILIFAPPALAYILYLGYSGTGSFTRSGLYIDFLLVMSAVITAIPLLAFGQAARRLPLTVLGFIQYLAPTLQFLTAVVILGEPLQPITLTCFAFIWVSLVLYSADSVLHYRRSRRVPAVTPPTPEPQRPPVPTSR